MASEQDSSDFIDGDYQRERAVYAGPVATTPGRALSREEVDAKVAEAQAKLAELKRAQEELERERAALEETRRRQHEFQTGRTEMVQNLTRGLGLLEEAEFGCRRDAEQMSRAIVEMREALQKVQAVREENWTQDNFNVQLTQALTALENARMEWNSARLKFPVLSSNTTVEPPGGKPEETTGLPGEKSFAELCRWGLALTWPVALAVLAVGALIAALLLKR